MSTTLPIFLAFYRLKNQPTLSLFQVVEIQADPQEVDGVFYPKALNVTLFPYYWAEEKDAYVPCDNWIYGMVHYPEQFGEYYAPVHMELHSGTVKVYPPCNPCCTCNTCTTCRY